MSKDDWLLRTENNKSFLIAWLIYIPLIVLGALLFGTWIATKL